MKVRPYLTLRELDVLNGAAEGLTNVEIGRKLFISHHTVRDNFERLYLKLDVSNKAGAVAKALREGLIS